MTLQGIETGKLTPFGHDGRVSFGAEDARGAWVGKVPSQIAPPNSGSGKVVAGVHQALRSNPGLSLRDLPPDVAQMVLDSRAETTQAIMEGWAESIRVNAELDKKAARAREQDKTHQSSADKQRSLFASVLNRLANRGEVRPADAATLRQQAGLVSMESAGDGPRAASDLPKTTLDALKPPGDRRSV